MKRLRVQIFATVFVGMLLLAAFLIYGQYRRSLMLSERLVLERLQSIAATLQPQINAEEMQQLFERFPLNGTDTTALKKDSNYQRITAIFRQAFDANELKTPIYTLTCDKEAGELRLGISSHGAATYGLLYKSHVQEHLEVYDQGGVIRPYSDEYGTWLSALVPLRGPDGTQIAALEVDYPFDDFVMYAEEDMVKNVRATLAAFVVIALLLYFMLNRMMKVDVQRQLELARTHAIIRQKSEDLEAGIRYAARIQSSLQPSTEELSAFFTDHLFLDLPKDTVSGDFLWFHQLDANRAFLAVADCTGHGVPGALMSIMGYDLLNDAVALQGLSSPAAVLEYLDARICKTFACKDSGQSADGMDVAICLIDRKAQTLTYAGARRPLSIVSENDVTLIEATRRSIGDVLPETVREAFTDHVLELEASSRYFLYSDGMQDQFGGEHGKKLGHRSLRNWFLSSSSTMAVKGRAALIAKFHAWKGTEEQVDDVSVFGFSI